MRQNPNPRSPRSPQLTELDLSQPLQVAFSHCQVIRVEIPGELPHWLSAGPAQARALVVRGAPRAHVWTIRELESMPWPEQPVTLGAFLQLLGSTARPVAVS